MMNINIPSALGGLVIGVALAALSIKGDTQTAIPPHPSFLYITMPQGLSADPAYLYSSVSPLVVWVRNEPNQ